MLSNGKIATAPCGHEGEHVIGQYVRCLKGCDSDSTKKPKAPIVPPGYDEAEWFTDIVLMLGGCRNAFFNGVNYDCHDEYTERSHAMFAYAYGQARRDDLRLDLNQRCWYLKPSELGSGFKFPLDGGLDSEEFTAAIPSRWLR